MNKTIPAIIGIAMLLPASSCNKDKGDEKPAADYPVAVVDTTSQTLNSTYAATITGCQTVEIRPQVEGLLTKILISEGGKVRKGQVLFEIDPAQFRAAYDVAAANVKSAEAAVATARLVLESNRELYREKVISDFELTTSENELAEAQAKLALAKAELERAATNLSYTLVKSPVDGVASMIPYRVGALVRSTITEPLVTVSDDGDIYAYFSMAENQMLAMVQRYGSVQEALARMPQVQFLMSNGEPYPHKGRIDAVSGTVDSSTGAIRIRAVFPNPGRLLRDGSTGSVVIPSDHTGAIVIPQSATYELQNRIFAYKVVNGKAASTEIHVLPNNNGRDYIVTDGLQVGDSIVTEGAGLIKEGTAIKARSNTPRNETQNDKSTKK